jgi:hypothetical protein
MYHGVDAGRGCDGRWQAQCQFGIEDRPVRYQHRRDNALLFRGRRGDNRDRRHFRAGASSRRREQERKAFALCQAHAENVVEAIRGIRKISDELGGVERASAANGKHQLNALFATQSDRPFDHMGRRIGFDLVEYRQ